MEKMILTVLVAGSLMAAGCGQQQQPAATTETAPTETQVQQAVSQGQQAAAEVQTAATTAVNSAVDQARTLVAQAKELLDSGKFEEAIAAAQKVLSIDPNNIDAQNIIETAKAKIQEMAKQKAGELQEGMMNKVNAFGN